MHPKFFPSTGTDSLVEIDVVPSSFAGFALGYRERKMGTAKSEQTADWSGRSVMNATQSIVRRCPLERLEGQAARAQ